jgi:hypothetical protein
LASRERSIELIVVDDGSTDASREIIDAARRGDDRIIALVQSPLGLVAALENGRSRARAPFLARLDADDLAYPDRLSRQLERFGADHDLVLLGTAMDKIDAAGRPIGRISYPTDNDALVRALWRRNPFVHSSVMMRRSTVEAAGGYRSFFLVAEDYDLWLRLSERGAVANLPEALGGHRIHPDTVTARAGLRQAFSVRLARRCARARQGNEPDPSAGMSEPIDLEGGGSHEPFASETRLFRALAFADQATFDRRLPTPEDLDAISSTSFPDRREASLAQTALVNILRRRVAPKPVSRLTLARTLIRIDAWRALRLAFTARGTRRSPGQRANRS